MDKNTIAQELTAKHQAFFKQVEAFGNDKANIAANGKWSPAEHLEHIRKSIKPLAMALGLPKLAILAAGGKTSRPSAGYDHVVAQYKAKLDAGAKSTGTYEPKIAQYDIVALSEKTNNILAELNQKIAKWDEGDLDKYLLPHPILGKLTVREMLYFTLYHVQHHAMLINRDYTK